METVESSAARSYAKTVQMVHSYEENVSTHNGQERASYVAETSCDQMAANTTRRMKAGNNLCTENGN